MDFIQHYIKGQEGGMSPLRYTRFSALFLLGAALGKNVFVEHGRYFIRCNNYFVLVGEPASKKSTSKSEALRMHKKAFPSATRGASIMTREQIVTMLSKEDYQRIMPDSYPLKGENGLPRIYTPCTFFINELKNFMSNDVYKMVEFLTDIYDEEDVFDAATVKHGLQPVIEPCINLLACVTPGWIVDQFKANIISGGIARRMIFIYEPNRMPRVTFPVFSDESKQSQAWCIAHMQKISQICGQFTWEPAARTFLDKWFTNLPSQDDRVFANLYESKDVLVTKLAMLLAMAQPDPKLVITELNLRLAIEFFDEDVEQNLPKLTIGLGQNKHYITMQRLLITLDDNKGEMPEIVWHTLASRDLTEFEYCGCMDQLRRTKQIVLAESQGQMKVFSAKRMAALVEASEKLRVLQQPLPETVQHLSSPAEPRLLTLGASGPNPSPLPVESGNGLVSSQTQPA